MSKSPVSFMRVEKMKFHVRSPLPTSDGVNWFSSLDEAVEAARTSQIPLAASEYPTGHVYRTPPVTQAWVDQVIDYVAVAGNDEAKSSVGKGTMTINTFEVFPDFFVHCGGAKYLDADQLAAARGLVPKDER